MCTLRQFAIFTLLLWPLSATQAELVSGRASEDDLPATIPFSQLPDSDLDSVARLFNGQHTIDIIPPINSVRKDIPVSSWVGNTGIRSSEIVFTGVVSRSDAYIAPDRTGVFSVFTIVPTAILLNAHRAPIGPLLRVALAGGIVSFAEQNETVVRQKGLRFPSIGSSFVFFAHSVPGSTTLLLNGACSPSGGACISLDNNSTVADLMLTRLGHLATAAQAFDLQGAPIAESDPGSALDSVAESVQSRYSWDVGDLRNFGRPLLMETNVNTSTGVPHLANEALLHITVLSSASSITLDGTGLFARYTTNISDVLWVPKGTVLSRTTNTEIYQRSGLLRTEDAVTVVSAANLPPLVEGGEYFVRIARTPDNRWDLHGAWRVVNGEVFALNQPHSTLLSFDSAVHWNNPAAFRRAATDSVIAAR